MCYRRTPAERCLPASAERRIGTVLCALLCSFGMKLLAYVRCARIPPTLQGAAEQQRPLTTPRYQAPVAFPSLHVIFLNTHSYNK